MLSSLRRKFGTVAAKVPGSPARRPRRHRPSLESLEGRQLLSLGAEFRANVSTVHNQFESDNASAANGLAVAVWVDEFSSTDRDIHAQMFNANGTLRGPEIIVENSPLDARAPSVAMDSGGDFVITWQQTLNGQRDILAKRFSNTGAPLGGILNVATSTQNEYDSDAAMDASGNFIVSYTQDFSATDQDVVARQFSSSGSPLQSLVVANSSSADESRSSVAMTASGQFVIAWQNRNDGTADEDIFLNRYNAAGTSIGGRAIATSTLRETNPSVAIDDLGNAVVAYQKLVGSDTDIKATRVSSTGVVGGVIDVRSTLAQEKNPTVALSRTGGSFVVAYDTDLLGVPGNRTVEVAEFNASNTRGLVSNLPGLPNNTSPALSIDAHGNYLLTYTGAVGSVDTNIHLRRGHLS
jgi:hypothetical protein